MSDNMFFIILFIIGLSMGILNAGDPSILDGYRSYINSLGCG